MSSSALRAQFPVLEHQAYLNAGTDGPLPAAVGAAGRRELERQLDSGRSTSHFERRHELGEALRSSYAALLGCQASELALTTCTSEGLATVIGGLRLGKGDEILTSDEEHPGLLGTLAAARQLSGVSIREAPLAELPNAVGASTRLIACSHVSWITGAAAPSELAAVEVPVVLDGAQGVGAIPVDVRELGCQAYAGAGQKWLCGPDGSGMLYVAPRLLERLAVTRRGYVNLADPGAGLHASLHADARRLDTPALSAETLACALAAVEVLDSHGWPNVHADARRLASRLVRLLSEQGRQVAARAETTLVSFASSDPIGERARLAEAGIVLRDIPGTSWLRASVGAWNDETDLQRLLAELER